MTTSDPRKRREAAILKALKHAFAPLHQGQKEIKAAARRRGDQIEVIRKSVSEIDRNRQAADSAADTAMEAVTHR